MKSSSLILTTVLWLKNKSWLLESSVLLIELTSWKSHIFKTNGPILTKIGMLSIIEECLIVSKFQSDNVTIKEFIYFPKKGSANDHWLSHDITPLSSPTDHRLFILFTKITQLASSVNKRQVVHSLDQFSTPREWARR